jgi:hypothetical protein
MIYPFGSGVLFGIPNAGNLATLPNPTLLPVLQEVTVEFKSDLKKLYGQTQYPLAKARGKVDVTGKGKFVLSDPSILGQLYFGQDSVAGVERPVFNESHTTAASVAPTQATADKNLGVINGDTGRQMQLITSGSPTIGQYKFTPYNSTGPVPAAYIFHASETASKVLLSYSWPDASNGSSLTLSSQQMGYAPEVQMVLFNNFRNKLFSLQLNSCVFGSISIPTKQEDFWISDFDFDASVDAAGVLGIIQADN